MNFHREKKNGIFPLIEFLGKFVKFYYKPNEAIIIPIAKEISPHVVVMGAYGCFASGIASHIVPLGTIVNGEYLIGRNIK